MDENRQQHLLEGLVLRFAAETLVDKAMELDHIGGTFAGNRKLTLFMCLVMKLLQIQPEKEMVIEFIKNDDCNSSRRIEDKEGFCPASRDYLVYRDSLFSDNPYLSRVHLLQETELRLDSTALGSKTEAKAVSPARTSSNTTAPGNLGRDMYVLVSYLMGILEVYLPSIEYVVCQVNLTLFRT
ncbi:hypothetical protein ABKV19_007702 [Rosa sericea]